MFSIFFFFNDTATTEIYTLSLHDALPIYAAIRDDFIFAVDALGFIQFLQIVERFERPVLVCGLRPGNIGGLGDVPGALSGFAHARRRDDFARELVNRANVDQLAGLATFDHGGNIFFERADACIGRRNAIRGWADIRGIFGERALFFEPFLAAAVHQAHVLVVVKL